MEKEGNWDKDIIYLNKNVFFLSYSRESDHWLAGSKQLESLETG